MIIKQKSTKDYKKKQLTLSSHQIHDSNFIHKSTTTKLLLIPKST